MDKRYMIKMMNAELKNICKKIIQDGNRAGEKIYFRGKIVGGRRATYYLHRLKKMGIIKARSRIKNGAVWEAKISDLKGIIGE